MQTQIGKDLAKAKDYLLAGEIVAIPTETVYGLAANALDPTAVIKIFETKNRPSFNPLIIHVADWEMVPAYVNYIPLKATILAAKFAPGPITFLLNKKDLIPDVVTAGSEKVAIRIPDHPLTQALLRSIEFPLAAPSANPFGYISPTTAMHVFENLSGKIPYILDGGAAEVGIESTIIGFDENERVILYRSGGVPAEAIEELLQEKLVTQKQSLNNFPSIPGQQKSHYAPHTQLHVGDINQLINDWQGKNIAIISYAYSYENVPLQNQFLLSPTKDLSEAAKNLFAALRAIDNLGADVILAEVFPEEGIGRAINDRLKRAGAENK